MVPNLETQQYKPLYWINIHAGIYFKIFSLMDQSGLFKNWTKGKDKKMLTKHFNLEIIKERL
jgi:hypothetical protein